MEHYRENMWHEEFGEAPACFAIPTPTVRRFKIPRVLVVTALVLPIVMALACFSGRLNISWTGARSIERAAARTKVGQHFIRVEDLPLAHRSVEDLPLAPPVAVRPLYPDEVTPALVRKADEVLWTQNPPMGAEVPIDVGGKTYIARIETHFHEVGGPLRPWGYHKGVTLYSAR